MFQARVGNYWAPLTYTLLPNEDEQTFSRAFKQVREAVESNGNRFTSGCEVMFDYDASMRRIYRKEIGNDYKHVLRGCSFHFGQCIINFVNGHKMMPQYKNPENTILRKTIQAALGIPYMRESDLEKVPEDLHSIFDNIEENDPETYRFLSNFVDNYIKDYWLKQWDKSELSFWGDETYFSSEHMTNNAVESYNKEFFTMLGKQAHPNPYKFVETLNKALSTTARILSWVEKGQHKEEKPRRHKEVVEARQKLKILFLTRLKTAETQEEQRCARINYMKNTGKTNTRILSKGRRVLENETKEKLGLNKDKAVMGRPKYERIRAPEHRMCRFCGAQLKKGGCKNHEKDCKKRFSQPGTFSCIYCKMPYLKEFYWKKHQKKCSKRPNQNREDSEEEDDPDMEESERSDSDCEDEMEVEVEEDEKLNRVSCDDMAPQTAASKLQEIISKISKCEDETTLISYMDTLMKMEVKARDITHTGAAKAVQKMAETYTGIIGIKARTLTIKWKVKVRCGDVSDSEDEDL